MRLKMTWSELIGRFGKELDCYKQINKRIEVHSRWRMTCHEDGNGTDRDRFRYFTLTLTNNRYLKWVLNNVPKYYVAFVKLISL